MVKSLFNKEKKLRTTFFYKIPLVGAFGLSTNVNSGFNHIQDVVGERGTGGGGRGLQKTPLYPFSPVASTKVGLSPQAFLAFIFNPFATQNHT